MLSRVTFKAAGKSWRISCQWYRSPLWGPAVLEVQTALREGHGIVALCTIDCLSTQVQCQLAAYRQGGQELKEMGRQYKSYKVEAHPHPCTNTS